MESAYKYCGADQGGPRCDVTLQNKELWRKFVEVGTEMIITKSGRRMFPALRLQIADLDPSARYCILIELTPKSESRYKYNGGWSQAGSSEPHSPHRLYMHPESPATGAHWMSQSITFNRLKLTNSAIPHAGHVVLCSMHMYQPKVLVVQCSDARAIAWAPTTTVVFPETQFIAVTAYQNDRITKLKIDNNPFAKGFRENGQSRCKRRRAPQEESPKKSSSQSDESISSSPEPIHHENVHPENVHPIPYQPWMYNYGYNYPNVYPSCESYCCYVPQIPTWPTYSYQCLPSLPKPQDLSTTVPKPKKLTDFSIKAITES